MKPPKFVVGKLVGLTVGKFVIKSGIIVIGPCVKLGSGDETLLIVWISCGSRSGVESKIGVSSVDAKAVDVDCVVVEGFNVDVFWGDGLLVETDVNWVELETNVDFSSISFDGRVPSVGECVDGVLVDKEVDAKNKNYRIFYNVFSIKKGLKTQLTLGFMYF